MYNFTSAGGMPPPWYAVDVFSALLLLAVVFYYAFVFYHVFKRHPNAVRKSKTTNRKGDNR